MERTVHQGCTSKLAWFLVITLGVGLAGALLILPHIRDLAAPKPEPPAVTLPPHTPWPTPPVAHRFDYPLQPTEDYAAYAQGVTGPRAIDTRYSIQNRAPGARVNCFRDRDGGHATFSELYHAGIDFFSRGP